MSAEVDHRSPVLVVEPIHPSTDEDSELDELDEVFSQDGHIRASEPWRARVRSSKPIIVSLMIGCILLVTTLLIQTIIEKDDLTDNFLASSSSTSPFAIASSSAFVTNSLLSPSPPSLSLSLPPRPSPIDLSDWSCPPAKLVPGYRYRLGDMVQKNEWRNTADGEPAHYNYFNQSMASEYMRRTKDESRLDILDAIIAERQLNNLTRQFIPDTSSALIVHLRIGDVIEESCHRVSNMLSEFTPLYNGLWYVKPLSYYEDVIEQIRTNHSLASIQSIVLIGGYHTGGKHTKSLQYVEAIHHLFASHGFDVHERINCDADSDFILMSTSRYFLPSGGGYSHLIRAMVLRHNGTTIRSNKVGPTNRLTLPLLRQLCERERREAKIEAEPRRAPTPTPTPTPTPIPIPVLPQFVSSSTASLVVSSSTGTREFGHRPNVKTLVATTRSKNGAVHKSWWYRISHSWLWIGTISFGFFLFVVLVISLYRHSTSGNYLYLNFNLDDPIE